MACPAGSFPMICLNGRRLCLAVDPRLLTQDQIASICDGVVAFGVEAPVETDFSEEDEARAFRQETLPQE